MIEARRTRGRPRQEDIARIETAVIEAALREFLEHGYGAASVTRIVRRAGVSKTTVYSRFASKAELFSAIMNQQIERLSVETTLRPPATPLDLVEGLTAYADRTLAVSLEGDVLHVNRLVFSECHRFPELGAAATERTALGIRRITAFVADCAIADGIPCGRPGPVAEAFICMLRGWYMDMMLRGEPVSADERRRWVDLSVRMLLSARVDW